MCHRAEPFTVLLRVVLGAFFGECQMKFGSLALMLSHFYLEIGGDRETRKVIVLLADHRSIKTTVTAFCQNLYLVESKIGKSP